MATLKEKQKAEFETQMQGIKSEITVLLNHLIERKKQFDANPNYAFGELGYIRQSLHELNEIFEN